MDQLKKSGSNWPTWWSGRACKDEQHQRKRPDSIAVFAMPSRRQWVLSWNREYSWRPHFANARNRSRPASQQVWPDSWWSTGTSTIQANASLQIAPQDVRRALGWRCNRRRKRLNMEREAILLDSNRIETLVKMTIKKWQTYLKL